MSPLASHLDNPSEHHATTALFSPAGLVLLCSAVLITLIGQYTDLDLALAELYFDPQTRTFPWDISWFATKFMHGWVKTALRWLSFLIIGLTVIDFIRPWQKVSLLRRTQFRVLALASIVEPFVIQTLKTGSNMHCPWAIDQFGGDKPFLRLLDWVPDGWQAGHCFPAGHASTAMWLCALAVFWLPHSPRKALLAFLGGSSAGLFLGWVQQMRGQHFLTHTLWTTWISAALLLFLMAVFSRQLLAKAPPATRGLQPVTDHP